MDIEQVKAIIRELKWSGTAGLNIQGQLELAEALLEYMEEEE
ncbi:hypothetical protein HWC53_gp077 [Bacillus phage vB_BmeM-Goe8]|uniref:Uncharacterized protein n=1 Tax=Bacillus phage vB_BmeM-Goe8 TaxID=2593638 RepID=A0A516KMH6_9CAUD|nr:hypothetical protein HWC53_gp001 [Bacillus phage vB_BmeM-Goe8]YP_009850173.1 hypothetical protein HWC53_gp077 [Bacillus phage vB_BmeM-Goe8]QDP42785.1 hypothetical protein Goe8_c00010 [Bacillus phage vB_BmeM-Goe8]QDP43012.1 hypothetical protein Goe8_c02390 [Bacillus phage vB_BmeM-Goe8]